MRKQQWAVMLVVLMVTSAHASVFVPTDGTVNFLSGFGSPGAATIGIFDDEDLTFSHNYLAIDPSGDQAFFTASGSDVLVTNSSGDAPAAVTLSGSNQFSIAARASGSSAWKQPDAVVCNDTSASCLLAWSGMFTEFAVDLAEGHSPATIPIPSSVLLLCSGLVGMVAVARRSGRNIGKKTGVTTGAMI